MARNPLIDRACGGKFAAYLTLLVAACVASGPDASALPFQLLEAPSAILVRAKGHEVKADLSVETDQIPTQALAVRYRYGWLPQVEVSGQAVAARFVDQDDTRLSEIIVEAKYRLPFKSTTTGLVAVARHREALGDPVVVGYRGKFNQVGQVVSRHADSGSDTSLGLLGRRAAGEYAFTLGAEYTHAGGRDYANFTSEQANIYTLYFAPERHLLKDSLMLAVENNYSHWENRGDIYDVIPQVRWEFRPQWIVEGGVAIPVMGGKTYRYIVGFTWQSGSPSRR